MSILKRLCAEKQEVLPLSPQKLTTDHGSITADPPLRINEVVLESKCDHHKPSEKGLEPMTWKRKLLFFASFHTWVLYVAMFFWIIPCRNVFQCYQPKSWKLQMQNDVDIMSNLEVVNHPHHLLIFGYRDVSSTEGHVAALNSTDGSMIWNATLIAAPTTIRCNLDDSGSCLAASKNFIAMFNVSDGSLLWLEIFASGEVEKMSIVVQSCPSGGSRIVFAVGLEELSRTQMDGVILTVVDGGNGLRKITATAPCSEFPLKMLSWSKGNTSLVLLCKSGRTTGIWTVPGSSLCSSDSSANGIEKSFTHYYHLEGLSDPVDNVVLLPTKAGLLVAWSRKAVLLADGRKELWKFELPVLSPGSQLVSKVLYAAEGRFLQANGTQIVLAVQNDALSASEGRTFTFKKNYELYLVEESEGRFVSGDVVESENLKSLRTVPGMQNIDFALLEMETENGSLTETEADGGGDVTTFYLEKFSKNGSSSRISLFTTTSKIQQVVFHVIKNQARLVVVEQFPNKTLFIDSRVLSNKMMGNDQIVCDHCDKLCP